MMTTALARTDYPADAPRTADALEAFARAGGVIRTHASAARTAPEVYRVMPDLYGHADPGAPTLEQQRTAYRSLIYTCSRVRARGVAEGMVQATAERQATPGSFAPVEMSHPWQMLLADPSPHYSARQLWQWAQAMKDLGRGAFFIIERRTVGGQPGLPRYLHPVFPAFGEMNPVGSPSGGIGGYVFRRSDGKAQRFEARDVVWIRHAHPSSPYESASLLEASAYEADSDLYMAIYRRDMNQRGGVPMVQITTDQELSDTQSKGLRDRWHQDYMIEGGRGQGKIPVFGSGSKLVPVGVSASDMEYVETALLNRATLLMIWGVPEGTFSDKANRANASAAKYTLYDLTIQPEAEDCADQLTVQLRAAFDALPEARLTVQVPDLVPLDPELLLRQDEMHVRTGLRTLNELRQRDGENPYPAIGDVPLVLSTLTPLMQVTREPETPAAPTPQASGDDDDEPRSNACLSDSNACLSTRDADDALTAQWRALDTRRTQAGAGIAEAARELFTAWERDALAALERRDAERRSAGSTRKLLPFGAASVADVGRWAREALDRLFLPIRRVMQEGWSAFADGASYSGTWNPHAPEVDDALRRIVGKQQSIAETVRDEIETALKAGFDAGEDVDAIADRLRGVFTKARANQARTVAQTASTAAFEAGQVAAAREAGARVRWLTQRDKQVRDAHDSADGQEREPGEAFDVGGYPMRHPADPDAPGKLTINCRCTMLPVLDDRSATRPTPRAWRVERDAQIKAAHASGTTNLHDLAEQFSVSTSTIERALGWKA